MPTITYAQALNEALREEMRADPRVFLMGEDIGHHGGIFRVTKDLIGEFGADRVARHPNQRVQFCGPRHWRGDGRNAARRGIVVYGFRACRS